MVTVTAPDRGQVTETVARSDTLPSMMNALRMVWIISRHYNSDDRMLPLMVETM